MSPSPSPRAALVGLCLSAGLVWLAFADVGVTLPTISKELDISIPDLQWVNNAFSLACGVFVLAAGRFSDVYGRRLLLLVGLVLLGAFSLLAAFGSGMAGLVTGRAFMGFGAALILPSTLALIPVIFPRERQPGAFAAWMAVAAVSQAAGPALGGLLTNTVGWRAVFWINAPLALVAFYLVRRHSPESRDESAPRGVDVPGLVTSAAGAFCLLYACTAGQEDGFTAPHILAGFVASAALLVAFVVIESKVDNPLVQLRLFRARDFDGALVANFSMNFVLGGVAFLLAIYLQDVRGYSAFVAGCLILPTTVTLLVFNPIGQRIGQRRGARGPVIAGTLVVAAGALISGLLWPHSPYWILAAGLLVLGAGIGLLATPVSDTAVAGPPVDLAGTASGLLKSTSMLGGSLGVAVLAAVASAAQTATGDRLAAAAGISQEQLNRLRASLVDSESTQRALSALSPETREAVMAGYQQAKATGTAVAILTAAAIGFATWLLLLRLWPRSVAGRGR